jgi:hypothetical protein
MQSLFIEQRKFYLHLNPDSIKTFTTDPPTEATI